LGTLARVLRTREVGGVEDYAGEAGVMIFVDSGLLIAGGLDTVR
jgi:hypothetical protein